jgi:hypothetical protein
MTAEKEPLFATADPNREFIRKAIDFLQRHGDYKNDPEARQILREYFFQAHMPSHDEMADKIVKQLTFRDELTGDKLDAVKDLREVYRFMREDVYNVFTGQHHPKSRELCDNLTKAREALDVLSAGYVDSGGLRFIQHQLDQEDPDADYEVLWSAEQQPLYEADGNILNLKIPAK